MQNQSDLTETKRAPERGTSSNVIWMARKSREGLRQQNMWSDVCSEKTIPGCKSLLVRSISSLLLNSVFYLVIITPTSWGKRKLINREMF